MMVAAINQNQRGDCDLPFFDCGDALQVFDSDILKGKSRLLRGCLEGSDCLSGILDMWPTKKKKRCADDKACPRRLRWSHRHQAGFCDDAWGCGWIVSEVFFNSYLFAKMEDHPPGNTVDSSTTEKNGRGSNQKSN